MLDLDSLKLFVRAAELGSLSKAASSSNIAVAAVSRRIAMLEQDFGVPLLIRNGRGVQLTAAGSTLLSRGCELLQLEAQTRADLADFRRGLRGVVSVMASTSAITQHLPQDLAVFSEICPDLRVELREAYTSDIVAALRDGSAEVGVVIAGPNVVDLTSLPYRTDRLAVVAPRHFRPGVQKARLADLAQQDFVVMEDSTAMTRLLCSEAAKSGIALRIRMKVGSFDAVCRMVEAGFGLGVQPRSAALHFLPSMGLRLIELEDAWATRQMLVCTPPNIGVSPAVRRLVSHLEACAAAARQERDPGARHNGLVDHLDLN